MKTTNRQTALITGASSGIGLELAKIFAKNGFSLVLVARSADKLHQLADEIGNSDTYIIKKDLSIPGAPNEVYNELQAKGIQVDVLVNNAGFGDFGHFVESNWTTQERMINLNIHSLTYLTHLLLPNMVKNRNGRILNVASAAAFQPGPLMSVYYASKAYVLHFSEAIANELEGTGVTVTALCPGATKSGFQSVGNMNESKLFKGKKMPSSKEVAEYGFQAMVSGKKVAIHGFLNYFRAQSIRLAPREAILKAMRRIQEKA